MTIVEGPDKVDGVKDLQIRVDLLAIRYHRRWENLKRQKPSLRPKRTAWSRSQSKRKATQLDQEKFKINTTSLRRGINTWGKNTPKSLSHGSWEPSPSRVYWMSESFWRRSLTHFSSHRTSLTNRFLNRMDLQLTLSQWKRRMSIWPDRNRVPVSSKNRASNKRVIHRISR